MEGGLHKAFVDELRDAYDAEKQLVKALPKLAKAASSGELKAAFTNHLEETRGHVDKLEQVFASIDERARGKHCDGIAGIIEEGKAIMEEDFDSGTMDACLIAAGQRSEHYEMAAYGTLAAWAKAMGHRKAADLLAKILEEEKAADEKLNGLAEGGINQQAVEATNGNSTESERPEGIAETVKRAVFGGPGKTLGGSSKKSSPTSTSRGSKRNKRKKTSRR